MLFRRKAPADWREKLRVALWPRRSWGRSLKYLAKRVLRLTASPHAIAAGIAAGAFASFTPFMGLHFLIAFALAYIIAGNMIAAAAGTFVGNPLTFPFIWAATFSTGNFILTGEKAGGGPTESLMRLREIDWWDEGLHGLIEVFSSIWDPVLKPMSVGAIPLGVTVGLVLYLVTRSAAVAFQISRRKKLSEKARRLKERAMASVAEKSAQRKARREERQREA